ncbi:CidA/LrgA family protein, partial [Legionella pneumophila]
MERLLVYKFILFILIKSVNLNEKIISTMSTYMANKIQQ